MSEDIAEVWRDISEDGAELRFQDFLTYRLGRLSTLVHRCVTARYLGTTDLTLPEWRVLARMADHASLEMRQLTRINLMDKAGISRAVDGLLAKGYVARHTDPVNAKRRIVAITANGRKLMRKVLPLAQREQASLLRMLSMEERLVFDTALDKLISGLLERESAATSPAIEADVDA